MVALDGIPSLLYRYEAWRLKRLYGLSKLGEYHKDLERKSQQYIKGDIRLGIEWNGWEGLVVRALNAEAEELVKHIGKALATRFKLPMEDHFPGSAG
jgi:hypothetical protein